MDNTLIVMSNNVFNAKMIIIRKDKTNYFVYYAIKTFVVSLITLLILFYLDFGRLKIIKFCLVKIRKKIVEEKILLMVVK